MYIQGKCNIHLFSINQLCFVITVVKCYTFCTNQRISYKRNANYLYLTSFALLSLHFQNTQTIIYTSDL